MYPYPCISHSFLGIWLVFVVHGARFSHDSRISFHSFILLSTPAVALDQTWLNLVVWLGTLKLAHGLLHVDDDEHVIAIWFIEAHISPA